MQHSLFSPSADRRLNNNMSQFSRIHTRRIDPETGETIELRQPLLLFPPGSE
jgi:hypothetical protein